MTTFMNEIARPCLPDDEHLDYIPTQVVSEYLTNLHKIKLGEKEVTIDAIIYRSAQNGRGKNIAIFGMAGVIEGVKLNLNYFPLSEKPALRLVDGSLLSHEITGVRHSKKAVRMPDPKTLDGHEDEDHLLPF